MGGLLLSVIMGKIPRNLQIIRNLSDRKGVSDLVGQKRCFWSSQCGFHFEEILFLQVLIFWNLKAFVYCLTILISNLNRLFFSCQQCQGEYFQLSCRRKHICLMEQMYGALCFCTPRKKMSDFIWNVFICGIANVHCGRSGWQMTYLSSQRFFHAGRKL